MSGRANRNTKVSTRWTSMAGWKIPTSPQAGQIGTVEKSHCPTRPTAKMKKAMKGKATVRSASRLASRSLRKTAQKTRGTRLCAESRASFIARVSRAKQRRSGAKRSQVQRVGVAGSRYDVPPTEVLGRRGTPGSGRKGHRRLGATSKFAFLEYEGPPNHP
ncbi:unnamed protein product, partial [Ectocarpus sp. 4 AP-2014]